MDRQHLQQANRRFLNLDERIVESLSELLHRRDQEPHRYKSPAVTPTWDPEEQRAAFDQAIKELERARAELRELD